MELRNHEAIAKGRTDIYTRVNPRLLTIDPAFNVRDLDAPTARAALDELKESVRAQGVQVPLEIRIDGETLFVVSGHRRHKVVMELIAEGMEIEGVPAIAEPKKINEAERTARLITLNSGEPLSALERGEVIRRLLAYGWDNAKITQRLGLKSVQTVANAEILLHAPEPVREAVRSGELAATEAVNITRAAEGDERKAVETLTVARATAKAAGKKKITAQSLPARPRGRPPGQSRPSVTPPEPLRPQGRIESALAALHLVITGAGSHEPYPAATAASVYMALGADDLEPIIDWLMEFQSHLKGKTYAAADAGAAVLADEPAIELSGAAVE